ncbi:hypothetical protein DW073_15265 [Ruminococcus sp. AF45-4BH]|nr:hypothetical protein DW073_15265 [Ruminococcus sp. AF45-4BH]
MYEEKKVGKIRFFDVVRCNDRDDGQRSGTGRGPGGGDYYEIAFSDDAENFENPAETEPGIEESSEAEVVPEEASGEEDVAFDVEMVTQNRLTL